MFFVVLGLTFEISEGGFLDIDVRIIGPEGKIIHQGERETSGKYTFAADLPGVYKYCFSNKMSTMTPKVVMFDMEIGDSQTAHKETEDGTGRLIIFFIELMAIIYLYCIILCYV